jgi:putative ABC transport system permease protein
MRPLGIFREEKAPQQRKLPHLILGAMLSIFVAALAIWHMQTLQFGLYVAGGIGVLILVSALLTQLLLTGLKRLHLKRLLLRQAVRGLFRNGNATRSVVITLTASVSVIFCIFLIEENLKATFIDSFPETTPNLFFIDIQPSQKGGFIDEIGKPVRFYPIVRARVTAINGKAVDPAKERQKRQDNFARVFNLTYHEDLLDNEKLIRGERLFRPDWPDIQVSILDVVTDMQPMQVGDTLQFNIQGVPLEARIASIRTRTKDSLSPFFYFVFRPQTLQDAPQTLFTAVNVARDRVGPLQARIAARFPNISAIDLSETLRVFGNMMEKLSAVVRMLSVLSIVAGLLILISAVFATRAERLVESVYFKTLGANQGFVVGLTALENGVIALLSTLLAMSMAQTAAYLICRHILNIHYQGFMGACILATAGLLILVIVIGLSAAWPILVKKPVAYLREQPDG